MNPYTEKPRRQKSTITDKDNLMAGYFERGLGARIYGEHREDNGRFNLLGESANLLDQLSLIDKTKPLHFYPHRLSSTVLCNEKFLNGEAPPRGPAPHPFTYHFCDRKDTHFKQILSV